LLAQDRVSDWVFLDPRQRLTPTLGAFGIHQGNMRNDPQFEKWCGWLETIRDDVQTLYFYRYIFQGIVDIVMRNERLDTQSPFFGFLERTYGDSIVMGIRRQLKASNESISLASLLREVIAKPDLVTRSDFFQVFKDFGSLRIDRIRHETFDRFALSGSPHVDPARVETDLQLLKDRCKAAEDYADRRIAHWDRRQPGFSLTFDDISIALDTLGEMVQKYCLLFFATHVELLPYSEHPVFDVFNEPWSVQSSL
jgi:hypothetical protein